MSEKITKQKLNQLQMMEQSLQTYLMQKQNMQAQLKEIETALSEIKNSKTAYKIIGGIMVNADKEELNKELTEKKDLLNLRIKTLEKQEQKINENAKELQNEVLKDLKKK